VRAQGAIDKGFADRSSGMFSQHTLEISQTPAVTVLPKASLP
jgi:hypothetical protein